MKFSIKIQTIGNLTVFLVLLTTSFSCKDDDKSENNSTGVEYNVPGSGTDTMSTTSGTVTTMDTANRSTTGRTSTGGKRGRVTVAKVPPPPKPTTKMETDQQGYYN